MTSSLEPKRFLKISRMTVVFKHICLREMICNFDYMSNKCLLFCHLTVQSNNSLIRNVIVTCSPFVRKIQYPCDDILSKRLFFLRMKRMKHVLTASHEHDYHLPASGLTWRNGQFEMYRSDQSSLRGYQREGLISRQVLELALMGLVTAAAPLIHCTKPEHTHSHTYT